MAKKNYKEITKDSTKNAEEMTSNKEILFVNENIISLTSNEDASEITNELISAVPDEEPVLVNDEIINTEVKQNVEEIITPEKEVINTTNNNVVDKQRIIDGLSKSDYRMYLRTGKFPK